MSRNDDYMLIMLTIIKKKIPYRPFMPRRNDMMLDLQINLTKEIFALA